MSSDQKLIPERALSRRDLIIAGVGGFIGVATGALGTVVTTYVQERARASLASGHLMVYPEVIWNIDGGWTFYSHSPIDLSTQPDITEGDDAGLISYLVENGCVTRSPLNVVLHLSRPGDSPAIIRHIDLINHRKSPPIDNVVHVSETAGANDNAVFAIDLDQRNARFVRSDLSSVWDPGKIHGQPDVFSSSTFSVGPHLTESMTLAFLSVHYTHEFLLRVQYFVEGREHSTDLNLAGLPFRVAPYVEKPKQIYCVPWYDNINKLVPCVLETPR